MEHRQPVRHHRQFRENDVYHAERPFHPLGQRRRLLVVMPPSRRHLLVGQFLFAQEEEVARQIVHGTFYVIGIRILRIRLHLVQAPYERTLPAERVDHCRRKNILGTVFVQQQCRQDMQIDDIRLFVDGVAETRPVRIEVELVAHMADRIQVVHTGFGEKQERKFHLGMLPGEMDAEVPALEVKAHHRRVLILLPFPCAVEGLQGLRHDPPVGFQREA